MEGQIPLWMEGNISPVLAGQTPPLQRPQVRKIAVFRALQVGDMLCAVPALRALRQACPHALVTLVGLPWAEQFARRFSGLVDQFHSFPGHPAMPEQAVRQDELAAFYAAMQAQHLDLAIQLHGGGPASNEVVARFGAALRAGFADQTRPGHDTPEWAMPYPQQGAEPARLLSLMHLLGADPRSSGELDFPITESDRSELEASGLTSGLSAGSIVCIHAGARLRHKCWPLDCFAFVADQLAAQWGLDIMLTGSPAEHALVTELASRIRHPALNAAQSLSLGAMAALMQQARLLVCNDTGVSHIAAGLALPSVVVFSAADMARWAPQDRARHRCIWDPNGERAALVLASANALLMEGINNSSASA